ncbi:MAG TPA: hypothetical protein VFT66_09320 [Roseiflexaceae bacterium]|jgi:hypothetical protein|nr:hypothetical protein [Roseiflexaceae bacterium]
MIALLLVLLVVGMLIGFLGQRMLNLWDSDQTSNLPDNTTHHHRT